MSLHLAFQQGRRKPLSDMVGAACQHLDQGTVAFRDSGRDKLAQMLCEHGVDIFLKEELDQIEH